MSAMTGMEMRSAPRAWVGYQPLHQEYSAPTPPDPPGLENRFLGARERMRERE